MSFTVTERTQFIAGSQKLVFATLAFDSSYPTGGEVLAASDFPSLQILDEVAIISQPSDGTEQVLFDRATQKVQVFTADATEQGNGTDPGITDLQVLAFGR